MDIHKESVFNQVKHELQSAALNRMDNGNLYIFMKEQKSAKDNYNLLIFDGGQVLRKSTYSFMERNEGIFLTIDDATYEVVMPVAISDDEAFTLTIKASDGTLITFENYI